MNISGLDRDFYNCHYSFFPDLARTQIQKSNFYIWLLKTPFFIMVFLVVFVHSGEIAVYNEWGHKLSTRVFTHLMNPDEMYRTAKSSVVLWFICYSLIQLLAFYFLIQITFRPLMKPLKEVKLRVWFYPIQFFIFMPLAFLMARGGWQPIPITISSAMFSNSPIVNDLCINSTYYLLQSVAQDNNATLDELFRDVDLVRAKEFSENLEKNCPDYPIFIDTLRPNLVFVILESWAADAISYSGKIKNTTPNFDV